MKYTISNQQARIFLLLKHGLLGEYKYYGNQGICEFINDVGCIQYDPVDVCGRNADLVLQARIKDYKKVMLYHELYEKRSLIDYWDKNMSIYSVLDWPYFERIRNRFKEETRSKEEVERISQDIKNYLKKVEYASSKDLEYKEKVDWYWAKTSLSRAALETMYYCGEVVIHHKIGTIRYFSLAENLINHQILSQPDPNHNDIDYKKWRVLRRIKGVGMLWNKPSDAFLFIKLNAEERNIIFNQLLEEGKIIEVNVENIKTPLYISKDDEETLKKAISNNNYNNRCEFMGPLDNMLWDRKLIKSIFDYEYTWEIYIPAEKRKFSHYVLPLLYGTNFIGRIEIISNKKEEDLLVKNIWFEENFKLTRTISNMIIKRLERLKAFNENKILNISDLVKEKMKL